TSRRALVVVRVAQEVEIRAETEPLVVPQRGSAHDRAIAEPLGERVERRLERARARSRRDPLRLRAELIAVEVERGESDEPDRRQRAEGVEQRERGAMEVVGEIRRRGEDALPRQQLEIGPLELHANAARGKSGLAEPPRDLVRFLP